MELVDTEICCKFEESLACFIDLVFTLDELAVELAKINDNAGSNEVIDIIDKLSTIQKMIKNARRAYEEK